MNNLTLKQLRYFDALVRHKHFGRAAEVCSVTQPALSVQIKHLEEMFGTALLERTSRSVHPTGAGKVLAERAKQILLAVDELGDLGRSLKGQIVGPLRLGMIPTVAPYLLPFVVSKMQDAYPNVDLRPREAMTDTLIEDLLSHRLDMAVLALPLSHPQLHETYLFEEAFVLARHSDKDMEPITNPERLRDARLLLLQEGHCFRDQALAFCQLDAERTQNVMEGSSLSTLVQMVNAGVGVTLIPEMAVAFEAKAKHVTLERFTANIPKRRIGIVVRKSSPIADHIEKFSNIVAAAGAYCAAQARDFFETG